MTRSPNSGEVTRVHDVKRAAALAKLPAVPVPAGFLVQPIDADEVAARLVELTLRCRARPTCSAYMCASVIGAGWSCRAARHYEEPALAALILSIATTNVFNRLNVATRQVAGAWG